MENIDIDNDKGSPQQIIKREKLGQLTNICRRYRIDKNLAYGTPPTTPYGQPDNKVPVFTPSLKEN